jgi:hypothetical protein
MKKSTNAKKAHQHFGHEIKKEMPILACIDDYSHHMGGVDIADQLRSYYDMQLTSWRTRWSLFFYDTDTMVQPPPQPTTTTHHHHPRFSSCC